MTVVRTTRIEYVIAAILVICTFCLYWQTSRFGFVNYDDDAYVYENPDVAHGLTSASVRSSFTKVTAGNWHPLTILSHAIDVELFGVSAAGPHLVNAGLHAVNAGLLFIALFLLTGNRWPAAFAAALFAWHPLRVESVAWISERKDLLSGLFFMLLLIAYARYVLRPSKVRYFLVLTSLLLGLLSKAMLVTAPCVLLLLDFWPLKRISVFSWTIVGRLIVEKLPMFALVVAFSAITVWAQRSERAVAGLSVLPISERAATAAYGTATYLKQLVWPTNLAPLYWHPYIKPATGLSPAQLGLAAGVLVLLSAAAVLSFRRAPWIGVGWYWYVGMLVPVSGLVQVGWQAHADRYTYLPMIGISVALMWTTYAFANRCRGLRPPVFAAGVCMLGALSWLTALQTRHWRDSESLWTRAVTAQPPNSVALNNLGQAATAAGENDRAAEMYRRAIEVNPEAAEPLMNLATIYIARGDDATAKQLLRRALPNNPWLIAGYSQLAGIYAREGRLDDALLLYRQAVKRKPDYADGYYNIATTLAQQGKFADAVPYFEQAIKLNPGDREAEEGLRRAISSTQGTGSLAPMPATQPN